jgi:hypothetical protein
MTYIQSSCLKAKPEKDGNNLRKATMKNTHLKQLNGRPCSNKNIGE